MRYMRPRHDTLFKDDDVLWIEAKVVVACEEGFRLAASRTAGHHIPGDGDGTLGLSKLGLCDSLKASDALGLVLEKGFVRGKANVVTAFWGRTAEPRALTASHQKNANLAIRHGLETDLPPFLCFGGVGRHGLACPSREGLDGVDDVMGISSIAFGGSGLFVNSVYALDVDALKLAGEGTTLWVRKLGPEGEEMVLAGSLVSIADIFNGHWGEIDYRWYVGEVGRGEMCVSAVDQGDKYLNLLQLCTYSCSVATEWSSELLYSLTRLHAISRPARRR